MSFDFESRGVRSSSEPEFRAWRKRVLRRSRILCAVGTPVGFALGLPIVWGLGIAGIVLSTAKLHDMKRREGLERHIRDLESRAARADSPPANNESLRREFSRLERREDDLDRELEELKQRMRDEAKD